MQNLSNIKKDSKIYFIGIGGISLSALAFILKNNNIEVGGSDEVESEITKKLEKNGVKVFLGHSERNVKKFNPSVVVFSSAVKMNNPEIIFAKKHNITLFERADFIHEMLKNYENVISISGTHGKTTTTSMIAEIFLNAGLNPTIHIGGESVNMNANFHAGSDKFFITEACEYKKSFLKFESRLAVILNVEEDHPDCYKNLTEIENAFVDFSKICKNVVVNEKYAHIFNNEKNAKKFISFGTKNAKFCAKNIKKYAKIGYCFDVFKNNVFYGKFVLNIFGRHNILNALSAICVCDFFNINKNIIKMSLENFRGVKRRFEKVETKLIKGDVYFDYAHHPTEIKKLISEVSCLNRPIICVFQPHTYSRTKQYFNKFLSSFKKTYQTIFFKTYPAREKKISGYSAKDLFLNLKNKQNCYYYKSFKSLIKHLKFYAKSNTIVLFVGAGDIYNLKNLINFSDVKKVAKNH